MSFESFYSIFKERIPQPYPELLFSRQELIQFISKKERFDVIVAGGGIHGAVCARTAALNGLKTLLLEAEDYASQTVLRIPDYVFDMIPAGQSWRFITRHRRNRQLRAVQEVAPHMIRSDSFLDEARFVQENMLAARQEGAACLNYARIEAISLKKDASVEVGWSDQITGEQYASRCGIVMNCTGAKGPILSRVTPHKFIKELEMGLDVCLYCASEWEKPALLSPIVALPLAGGVLIGAHFPGEKEFKPEHTEEILEMAGVRPEAVLHATSAERTKVKNSSIGTWHYIQGTLHLLPGASLYAFDTAYQGVGLVFDLSNVKQDVASLYRRPLPGGWNFEKDSKALSHMRYGTLFQLVSEDPAAGDEISHGILKGEVRIAKKLEQARTAEDVILRRLGLRMMPEEFSSIRQAVEEFMSGEAA